MEMVSTGNGTEGIQEGSREPLSLQDSLWNHLGSAEPYSHLIYKELSIDPQRAAWLVDGSL